MSDHREVLDRARADGVKFVSLQFTDVAGAIKNVTIPVQRLEDALTRGVWFDGSSIEGFARIYESDMFLKPDATTYRVLPWGPEDRRVARLICDVHLPTGEPFPGDPRHVLKRALAQAGERGYIYNIGAELEFFLFKPNHGDVAPLRPVPHDVGGYFDFSPRDQAARVREDITLTLQQMGIEVEAAHHEVAEGQHEIDFEYADALTSADNCVTFKYTVKAIAQRHELYATFMPKPIAGINGSGMHTHQSLFSPAGDNLFYDPKGPYRLSKLALNFVAGQLAHAPALAAIVAPTVNSYKRLVPGYEAPVYICWGQVNRSALIRIPRYSPGREQSTRVELRFPDPSCNPYLAFASMLAVGLDGIDQGLTPPEPLEESAYELTPDRMAELGVTTLPGSLGQALRELAQNEILQKTLGSHAYEAFTRARQAEWDEYRLQVTQWELDRYLEVL